LIWGVSGAGLKLSRNKNCATSKKGGWVGRFSRNLSNFGHEFIYACMPYCLVWWKMSGWSCQADVWRKLRNGRISCKIAWIR